MIGSRFTRTAITIGIVATAPAVAAQQTPPPPTFVDDPAYIAARTLVDAFVTADTAETRYAAAQDMIQALNVGVYSASGVQIVAGAERSPDDLYLYDFELRVALDAAARGQQFTMSNIARELGVLGVRPEDRDLTADETLRATAAGIEAALSEPSDDASLGALLLWELGMRQPVPVDLRYANVDSSRLDPIQRLILITDLLKWIYPEESSRGQTRLDHRSSQLTRNELDATGLCDFTGNGSQLSRKLGKLLLAFIPSMKVTKTNGKEVDIGKEIRAHVRFALILADLYHAGNLALLVDVQPTTLGNRNSTHYGPAGFPHMYAGAEPGARLQLQIGVQMLMDMSEVTHEIIVKCGRLGGWIFPPKGPIPNVPVDWDTFFALGAYDRLKKHGVITYQDNVTQADGTASLILEPRDELFPSKSGMLQIDRVTLHPTISIFAALGNNLATVNDIILPMGLLLDAFVEFHSHWEGSIEYTAQGVTQDPEGTSTVYVHNRVSFDPVQPAAGGWDERYSETRDDQYGHIEEFSGGYGPFTTNVRLEPSITDNFDLEYSLHVAPPIEPQQMSYTMTVTTPYYTSSGTYDLPHTPIGEGVFHGRVESVCTDVVYGETVWKVRPSVLIGATSAGEVPLKVTWVLRRVDLLDLCGPQP
jgi:hypothetical protein